MASDAWPRTRRPLPWLLAGFLAVVFLVPVEAVHMRVSLPVSSDLDRFCVALLLGAGALAALLGRGGGPPRLRPRGWSAGFAAFVAAAVASVAVNADRITILGEWEIAQRRLALLLSLAAVFALLCLSLRPAELRSFAVLIALLATLTALGTIYEKERGENPFYATASALLGPVAAVDEAPTDVEPEVDQGRPLITGPTRHPLSVASLLGMGLPFAVVLAAVARGGRRALWALAAALIAAGAAITQRKAGLVIPAVALLALFAIRPRLSLRLAPYGIAALALAVLLAPGVFSSFQELGRIDSRASIEGRTSDYPAIMPDLLSNPLLGRGYGTLDSERADTYRILDNEYLGQAFQVGGLGLLAFLAMIVTPLIVVRDVIRSDDPARGPPALAAGAACVAFGVAAALYDILSFVAAPYLFLYVAAICVCAASVERAPAPPPAPVPERRAVAA